MKMLAACLLAIALTFRAAPLCAAPVPGEAVVSMPECSETTAHHTGDHRPTDRDTAAVCHACVFPPVAAAPLAQPVSSNAAVPAMRRVSQLAGDALKPPIPPPRPARFAMFHNLKGVRS